MKKYNPPMKQVFGRVHIFALFLPEIKELLKNKDFVTLKELLKGMHSIDIAQGLERLEPQEMILVFKLLSFKKAVEVFEDLRFKTQSYLLNNLESKEIGSLLNEMAPDERARLFKDLPQKVVKKLFSLMKKEEVDDVRKLLNFKEGTAGSLMTTEVVELKKDMTARKAIIYLQEKQKSTQEKNIYSVYVTDEEHHLLGGLSLQTLITAPPDIFIKDIMSDMELIKIEASSPEEEVARKFSRYDLLDAPVIDKDNHLLGIITIDDVVDLINQEATEDFYALGKISTAEPEIEINYAQASILSLVRRRVVWLFVLLLIGTFVSGKVIKGYTSILQTVIVLATFLPVLMDSAGNAGQQSLSLIVRGLATGEVRLKDVLKIIRKEILVGFLMGLLMGFIGFIGAFLLQGFNLRLGLTVGLSITTVITLSSLIGATLPLFFKRIGFDPAVSASPFITTFVDATTLIVYFEIAKRLMFKH